MTILRKRPEVLRVAPSDIWCYETIRYSNEKHLKLMSRKFLACFDN